MNKALPVCLFALLLAPVLPVAATPPASTKPLRIVHRFLTDPRPPYPLQARYQHAAGTTIVRITFNEAGNVEKVLVTKGSGFALLDTNTVGYIKAYWKVTPGPKLTFSIPIEYRIY